MAQYVKRVTRVGDQLLVEDQEYTYDIPNDYRFFFLDQESEEWQLTIFDVEGEFADIRPYVSECEATIGYITDTSLTMISFRDDGVARKWGDLRFFSVDMMEKTFKYMGMMGQQTYLHGLFRADDIIIDILPTPEDEEIAVDGRLYISPEFRDVMVEAMYSRIIDHDPEKAEALYEEFKGHKRFNGRLVTSEGFFKGDFIVRDHMGCHVQSHDVNFKHAVRLQKDDSIVVQMFPQKNGGDVRTDPQTLSAFYHWLLDVPTPGRKETMNLIKDAFKDVLEENTNAVLDGRIPPELLWGTYLEVTDEMTLTQYKAKLFYEERGSLHESLYLTEQVIGQVLSKYSPPEKKAIQKRRFPVPYAMRMSLSNERTLREVTGIDRTVDGCVLSDIGLMVADSHWDIVAQVLGGADQDDHVAVHLRVALDDDEFFGITKGDIVAVLIRNPIGAVSDGINIGVEYYVLPLDRSSHRVVLAQFGQLPGIRMADRPLCTAEIILPEPTFMPTPRQLPKTLTKKFIVDTFNDMAQFVAVYGTHALLVHAHVLAGIPFAFRAEEETYVDVCQQTRNPVDLSEIAMINEEDFTNLALGLVREGKALDTYVAKRLGLDPLVVPTSDGLFTELIKFHKSCVEEFAVKTNFYVRELREELLENVPEDHNIMYLTPGVANTGLPFVMGAFSTSMRRYQAEQERSLTRYELWSSEHRHAIGNKTMDRFDELVARGSLTEDKIDELFVEAFRAYPLYVKPGMGKLIYTNGDSMLMQGRMFNRLLTALRRLG